MSPASGALYKGKKGPCQCPIVAVPQSGRCTASEQAGEEVEQRADDGRQDEQLSGDEPDVAVQVDGALAEGGEAAGRRRQVALDDLAVLHDELDLATAAGVIGGAVAGSRIEEATNRGNAQEMEIRRDDGQRVVIVQKADQRFQTGQRVRLIGSGANMTVAPY